LTNGAVCVIIRSNVYYFKKGFPAMFTKAKWIWLQAEAPDTYADFISDFEYSGGKAILRISADSNYAAYINGELAAFGQYADYPTRKIADEVDVTGLVKRGANRLAIIAYYCGAEGFFTYAAGRAGVIFELEADSCIVAASDDNTLSRLDPGYKQERCVKITSQLGFDFYRDEIHADDSFILTGCDGFSNSRIVTDGPTAYYPRPNKKLTLGHRQSALLMRTGTFEYKNVRECNRTASNMNFSAISFVNFNKCCDKPQNFDLAAGDGAKISVDGNVFVMIDLGCESVGFLDIDIDVPHDCRIDIGWGEHLYDGICRTDMRSFAVSIDAKAGRNSYMNPFRRFGCRYIQLFIHAKSAKLNYAGIRPTDYPLNIKPFDSGNILRDAIYSTCVDTLRLCMHEHYEDCPWREQALYALDSRNQMLCGYFAFSEYEFARASLHLMGESITENGLLSICAPMTGTLKIPSFSLAYFIQMQEYIKYSGDTSLAEEMYETLERVMGAFTSRIDETGLARSFEGGKIHWNFYEWSPTLSGDLNNGYDGYEAMLNLYIALALEKFADICVSLGKNRRADELNEYRTAILKAVNNRFYNEERNLYHTSDEHMTSFSVLVNAFALLTGAADVRDKSEILRILAANGKDENGNELPNIIPNTLSMNCFRFDALLKYDREKYASVILDEIDRNYLAMLRTGATTFYETLDGNMAFGGAGSLCHGWSALPVYYYHILL